jgi:uncharacterized protein (TIGR03435 family)
MKLIALVLGMVVIAVAVVAAAQAPAQTLKFEVASVKPSNTAGGGWSAGCYTPSSRLNLFPRGMCIARNASLRSIIAEAYGISAFDVGDYIIGGPGWMSSDRFEIEGKAENLSATPDELHAMLRNLLAERFKLQAREEMKDAAGYALVIGKNRTKLKATSGDKPLSIAAFGQPANELEVVNASMTDLAAYFFRHFRRPFVDKTGLTGRYDFNLMLLSDDVPQAAEGARKTQAGGRIVYGLNDSDLPAVSKALQDQLGLRLQPEKLPLRIVVIDHAERPDAN